MPLYLTSVIAVAAILTTGIHAKDTASVSSLAADLGDVKSTNVGFTTSTKLDNNSFSMDDVDNTDDVGGSGLASDLSTDDNGVQVDGQSKWSRNSGWGNSGWSNSRMISGSGSLTNAQQMVLSVMYQQCSSQCQNYIQSIGTCFQTTSQSASYAMMSQQGNQVMVNNWSLDQGECVCRSTDQNKKGFERLSDCMTCVGNSGLAGTIRGASDLHYVGRDCRRGNTKGTRDVARRLWAVTFPNLPGPDFNQPSRSSSKHRLQHSVSLVAGAAALAAALMI
ncbi:hypothetical protein CXG81DRAFT_18263 [Caulochytrium protostelioides]|uniref:WSC domain-containing protein n=1 Tax=Caulochytrium protostelioides TaxID=1555241 RepID=A0A4P9X9N0_9FUNG|nr:hypothetical protein CXG81DRAFT_18263 [Caulochytrium protostelioides]|eukprot:RKP02028.1 hypothetical protein CXG81DRAFT_18263 [Caulochytrium protostelioides]